MTEQIIKHQTPHIAKHVLVDCASSEVYLMDCIEGMKHYPDSADLQSVSTINFKTNLTKLLLNHYLILHNFLQN